MNMIDRLKGHWFIAVLLVCTAVAGTTWKLALEILVAPRDFQITQQHDEILRLKATQLTTRPTSLAETPLMLEQTGVFAGNSVTTKDGRCNVRIIKADKFGITLAIVVDSNKPVEFKDRRPGDRVTIEANGRVYYIDLHRIRGDIVDLEIFGYPNSK